MKSTSFESIMDELKNYSNDNIKRIYINHGASEPLFGVKTEIIYKLAKKYKINHNIALQLISTGNYDAMNLATYICDPKLITINDLKKWQKFSTCYGVSDWMIAIVLAYSNFATTYSIELINSKNDFDKSTGWNCWCHIIKENKNNNDFYKKNKEIINKLLKNVKENINNATNWEKNGMNNFLISVGCFIDELYDKAIHISKNIPNIKVVYPNKTNCKTPNAYDYITKCINKKNKKI